MNSTAISLLTYLSRDTYSYFQDIMDDLALSAEPLSALLLTGTEMGIFENALDDWKLKRQPSPEEIEEFITKFPKITDFSTLDISLHGLDYYIDPLVFIEISVNEKVATTIPPQLEITTSPQLDTELPPEDAEQTQDNAPEPKKYYFETLNQQAGMHTAQVRSKASTRRQAQANSTAQPQAKPRSRANTPQNSPLSHKRPRRRTNKLTYNKQKSYEEGITKLKELQDELRRLRRLQSSDTPGFNDFDRGAMK